LDIKPDGFFVVGMLFVIDHYGVWIDKQEKTRVKKELENMGVTVYPSETNFLMI